MTNTLFTNLQRKTKFLYLCILLAFTGFQCQSDSSASKTHIYKKYIQPNSTPDVKTSISDFAHKLHRSEVNQPDFATDTTTQASLNDPDGTKWGLGFSPLPSPTTSGTPHKRPLLIYLHGGLKGAEWDKGIEAWKMFSFLQDSLDIQLASPTATRSTPWWSPRGIDRILQTIRFMQLHAPIDMDRIFLAGVSDGATGSFAAANYIGGCFAGIIPICGFGPMLSQFDIELWPQNMASTRMLIFQATEDRLFPIEITRRFATQLGAPPTSASYVEMQGARHGFEFKSQVSDTIISFISNHTRKHYVGAVTLTLNPPYPFIGWDLQWYPLEATAPTSVNWNGALGALTAQSGWPAQSQLFWEPTQTLENSELSRRLGQTVVFSKIVPIIFDFDQLPRPMQTR